MPEDKIHRDEHDTEKISAKADSRLREEQGPHRSGSDSDAMGGRKQSRLHEHQQNDPLYPQSDADFDQDLHPQQRLESAHGVNPAMEVGARSANDIKELHTRLADLSDTELKNLTILAAGTHLEQGAKYIDLGHLEQGEFTAKGDMIAAEESYYVAKKGTDYQLWNRINQVDTPARLDEPDQP